MDMGDGTFKQFENKALLDEYAKHNRTFGSTFRMGEEVELKGSRFRVKKITPKELRLKLLPHRKD